MTLASLKLGSTYRTGETDPAGDFYMPCLDQAVQYDRAAGYFRSSVFLVVGRSLFEFFKRGGRMRLVCSPDLCAADHKAISEGYLSREMVLAEALNREIAEIVQRKEVQSQALALATLIKIGVLDIKIAYRASQSGIFHEKLGIFTDPGGNQITFKGSVNETWSAWHPFGNFESFEVFCSWLPNDKSRVVNHNSYFERLWNGQVPSLETLEFPEASRKKIISFAYDDLHKLIHSTRDGRNEICDLTPDPLKPVEMPKESPEEVVGLPKKKIDCLFPHQAAALENWRKADFRGIFKHATGSGKTVTALAALREHLQAGGVGLVLVPSRLLLRQWQREIQDEISGASILLAGDGNVNWRDGMLAQFCMADAADGPRLVLSTMQTASMNEFIRMISRSAPKLLLVADEVHQMGSPENSRLFDIDAAKRIGLSATPERYGDAQGTGRILNHFGSILEPQFTLNDAIEAGRLVKYEYHPTAVHLTAEEADDWKRTSRQISLEIAKASSREKKVVFSERARNLLIKRARIAKKARAKITYASKTIERFRAGEKWLVYCEDAAQLAAIRDVCREKGVESLEYHSRMVGSREANLDWFRRHGGVLISIRCLDEGIDIPEISHAVILASSQNPRQFIQRRGRVLRQAEWKDIATIYDVLVMPVALEIEPEQESLLKSELCRAIEFANGAINKAAGAELRKLALEFDLDIEEIAQFGIEEQGEDADE